MKLILLEAKNFMSFPELKVNLEEVGLCLISGRNLDENDSNGSGKSTILSAVTWALFGKTLSGLQADDVLSWTKPMDCFVCVWFTVFGKNVQVTRYRNYGPDKSNEVEVITGGEVHRGKIREMQDLIDSLLGFDYNTLLTTAVYSANSAQMLAGATDATRREVFAQLLDLGQYQRAHDLAKERAKEAERGHSKATQVVEKRAELLAMKEAEFTNLSQLEANYDNERKGKIEALEQEERGLGERERVKPLKAELQRLESELDGIDIKALEKEAHICNWDLEDAKEDLDEREKYLLEIDSRDACDACGRRFEDSEKVSAKEIVRGEIKDLKQKVSVLTDKYQRARTTYSRHNNISTAADNTRALIAERERNNERRDADRRHIIRRIEEYRGQTNPYTVQLTSITETLADLKVAIKKAAEDRDTLNIGSLMYDDLADLFGKKGIQAYVIENSFGFIEERTNQYLSVLTGGSTAVEIAPQRETKSGDKKEEIDIRVYRGSVPCNFSNLSGGEQQRVAISLLFAVNAFMRQKTGIAFLLLDEVLDLSLDETGQEALMGLLREIALEVPSIFVISHKQFIKEYFNNNIVVVKKDGVSKII